MIVKSGSAAEGHKLVSEAQDALRNLQSEAARLRAEVASLEDKLRSAQALADHDPLLPVLNRRAFLREMSREIAYMRRYKEHAGLIYFDIDDFKQINDTHGHQVGDMVLEYLAHLILENVRETDIVGRIGGDEFAIMLVRADEATTKSKAEALAHIVSDEPLVIAGVEMGLSISTGAVAFKGDDEPDMALSRADAAMYAAKRARK